RVRGWRQRAQDLVERERVAPKDAAAPVQEFDRARAVFVVTVDRRPLAVPGLPGVADLHDDGLALVGGVARDHERLGELVRDGACLEFHAGSVIRGSDATLDDLLPQPRPAAAAAGLARR